MKTYVTFGQDHIHQINGKIFNKDCVAIVDGDRARVFEIFGDKFCFEYTEEMFNFESMKFFPKGFIVVEESKEPERTGIIYLAVPYSHKDESIQEERFEKVNEVSAYLLRNGFTVLSPISMMHPVAKYGLPTDWKFWAKIDTDFMLACEKVLVLRLEGWETSVGVTVEIKLAESLGIEVGYMDYDDIRRIENDGRQKV